MPHSAQSIRLTDASINEEVTDDHILKVYKQLESWKRLAAHLGLTRADIRAIESESRSDEKLMRLHMLQEWKEKKRIDGKATYKVLMEAMLDCDNSNSAVQVCELLEHRHNR